MKTYEMLELEVHVIRMDDVISTSIVIGDKTNNDGGDTSWGDLGGGNKNIAE